MKNAMKKFFSIALALVLLIGTLPFAASAATSIPVEIYQSVDGADVVTNGTTENLSIAAICEQFGIGAGEFDGAWVTNNGKEHKKNYDESFGETSTLVKIRKVATVTTVTCDNCGASYKKGEEHECPKAEPVAPIKIVVKVGSSNNVVWTGEKLPANGEYALAENLLTYCWNSDWENVYTVDHAWSTKQQANVANDAKIYAGDTLSVMLKEKSTSSNTGSSNSGSSNSGLTDYTKFAYPVYLNIYTDTTVGTVKKTVNITEGIAADGIVTLKEVKSVVDYYYNAVDSDKGIQVDGLYPAKGNWVHDYAADTKYERIEGLYEAAAESYVYINVMVTNAKLASSSTADSTNPKTGDAIFAPIAVMAVSASALALFFFYNKKRAI